LLALLLSGSGCFAAAAAETEANEARIRSTIAQGQAKARADQANTMSNLASMPGMAGVTTMKTVPFSEAPKPAGGPGWYCFEYRSKGGREPTSSSRCTRTLAECRSASERQAQRTDGSTREPVAYEVGTCTKTNAAHCIYFWGPGGAPGAHECSAQAEDCKPIVVTRAGASEKQSECGRVE
jgi:hypothetical protein